jgi:hypothetical protein
MQTLLWAGLAANALVHLRIAVLQVQDGVDRVAAGDKEPTDVIEWKDCEGAFYIFIRVLASPVLTAYAAAKFLLFPRGIKSRFAREQKAKAQAEALHRAERDRQEELEAQLQEAHALVAVWSPGEFLCPEPEQVALGWHHAADALDAAEKILRDNAGQPWIHPAPPRKRTKAKVLVDAGIYRNDCDEE